MDLQKFASGLSNFTKSRFNIFFITILIGQLLLTSCMEDAKTGLVVSKYFLEKCPKSLPLSSEPLEFNDPKFVIFKENVNKLPIPCHGAIMFSGKIDWSPIGFYQNSTNIIVKKISSKTGCWLYIGSEFHNYSCKNGMKEDCEAIVSKAENRSNAFVNKISKNANIKILLPQTRVIRLDDLQSIKDFCSKPISEWP